MTHLYEKGKQHVQSEFITIKCWQQLMQHQYCLCSNNLISKTITIHQINTEMSIFLRLLVSFKYCSFYYIRITTTGHINWWLLHGLLSWYPVMYPDSKVHGANIGPTWVLSAPDGPHVGPMNLAVRVVKSLQLIWRSIGLRTTANRQEIIDKWHNPEGFVCNIAIMLFK